MSDNNVEDQANIFTEAIGEFGPEELQVASSNTMDVTRKLFAIRRLQKEVDKYNDQCNASLEFYNRKIEQLQKQVQYLEQDIWAYLNRNGEDKIVTPAGTAFLSTKDKWRWTEDEQRILEWSAQHAPQAIITEQKISYSELRKHIKQIQEIPQDIVEIKPETKINIRTF